LDELFMVIDHAEMVHFFLSLLEMRLHIELSGIPFTEISAGNAYTHSAYPSRGPTALVLSIHARVGHRSQLQSDNFPDWNRDKGVECKSPSFWQSVCLQLWHQVESRVSTVEGVLQLDRFLTTVEDSDIPERLLVVHM
jgi:hypothetical protein